MAVSSSHSGASAQFANFREFYPYYLEQHTRPACRRLHLLGTGLALLITAGALISQHWVLLLAVPPAGYLPAWFGHFVFQGNSPATFRHPLYSLRGDFLMLGEVLAGRVPW